MEKELDQQTINGIRNQLAGIAQKLVELPKDDDGIVTTNPDELLKVLKMQDDELKNIINYISWRYTKSEFLI